MREKVQTLEALQTSIQLSFIFVLEMTPFIWQQNVLREKGNSILRKALSLN